MISQKNCNSEFKTLRYYDSLWRIWKGCQISQLKFHISTIILYLSFQNSRHFLFWSHVWFGGNWLTWSVASTLECGFLCCERTIFISLITLWRRYSSVSDPTIELVHVWNIVKRCFSCALEFSFSCHGFWLKKVVLKINQPACRDVVSPTSKVPFKVHGVVQCAG